MAMINELRQIVESRLNSIKTEYGLTDISYRIAKRDQLFPHIVFDITDLSPTDMGRTDFLLDLHIWGKDPEACFDIMDAVRELFAFWNQPGAFTDQTILPTFYEMSGGQIDDPDKTLCHLVMRIQAQVFESTETSSTILWKERPQLVSTT